MKTAKEILDSLHPIEKAIVEREFARQRDRMCETCPLNELLDGQVTPPTKAAVADGPAAGYKAEPASGAALSDYLKILWVDDDKVVHAMAKKLFTDPRLTVHMAEGGFQALDLLKKHRFDLMITDLGMPGMTGWQLTAKIKGRFPHMQIAILTGLTCDISQHDLDRHGVRYCMHKPLSKEEAAELIEQVRANR